jgi:NAD-dependent SIR2 family protein deacetylase
MNAIEEKAIEGAARAIDGAEALIIGAGAGMGVDSGLPDFRGPEGFWRAYPAYAKLGLRFEQMASPDHFVKDPALGWGFYGHRTNLYRQTIPHDGFAILKSWADRMAHGAFVYTSNVDGHFQKAGFADDRIIECHGSVEWRQCLAKCGAGIFPADDSEIPIDPSTFRAGDPLPSCPRCGKLARPNILMFGDWGWDHRRSHEQGLRIEPWLEGLEPGKAVIVELGAGQAIPTVRYFCEETASALGATLIRINLRESEVARGHIGLAMGALDALRAIDDRRDRSSRERHDQG